MEYGNPIWASHRYATATPITNILYLVGQHLYNFHQISLNQIDHSSTESDLCSVEELFATLLFAMGLRIYYQHPG